MAIGVQQSHGFCFISGPIPIEDFCGNADEDLLAWLLIFEDHFNVSKNASLRPAALSLRPAALDQVKAKHLIAKLRDPLDQECNLYRMLSVIATQQS